MSAISDRYHDIPGFDTFFYGLVPALSLAGIALLFLWLAVRRQVLVGSVAVATQVTALMVAGGVGIGVALYAVARQDSLVTRGLSVSPTRVGR